MLEKRQRRNQIGPLKRHKSTRTKTIHQADRHLARSVAGLNLLERWLVQSLTTVTIPFYDRIIFVGLFDCAEFSGWLPNGKHDDQADSTSQALDWVKQGTHSYPVFEYMRREALRNGSPIDLALLDDDVFYPEGEPVKCSRCGNEGPAQSGSTYH